MSLAIIYDLLDLRTERGFKRRRGVLSADEPLVFNLPFPDFDDFSSFLLELEELSVTFFEVLEWLEAAVTLEPVLDFV